MRRISVVIPTLNEEDWIERTLESVIDQSGPMEIVVADGGSSDETRTRASVYAEVVGAPKGRAAQMNAGAAHTSGDILLFLHADTLLPEGAFATIRTAVNSAQIEAGAFRLQFDHSSPLLNFYSWCTRFHSPSICFGDRGLFVKRSVFRELGGYPELPMFEDLEMVRRLYERGGFLFARPTVTTAARRFTERGPLRQQLQNTYLWLYYMLGGNPHRVVHLYEYEGS